MMDELERLKGKFRLVMTTFVFLLLLSTAMMGAFHGREIDDSGSDDANGLEPSSTEVHKSTSLSSDKEGLFLDIVDESENSGEHTSIEVREVGYKKLVYISYYSKSLEALKIAKNDIKDPESDWKRWTIDQEGDVGRHSSLEVDENRKAHIAYYDSTNTRLKYTLWNGDINSVECTEVIDGRGEVGKYASLELDEDYNPSVSYYDSSRGGLKYAELGENGWETLTVDDNGEKLGRYTSLALDSDSEPHISFYDWEGRDLKYAEGVMENGTTSWNIQTVEKAGGLVGKYTSLELDEEDDAHISCYEWSDGDKRLKYVTDSVGNRWTSENVSQYDLSGTYTSLELYGSGNPLISYHEWGEENLRLAVKKSGEWENFAIDTEGRVGSYASLNYVGEAETHISYYDQGEGDLRHARYFFKNRTPLAPQSFRTNSEYGEVILDWNTPIYDGIKAEGNQILGYHIYRSNGDGFEKIDNVTGFSYRDEVEKENESKAYEYRVAAVNRKGVGDNTSIIKTRARYFSYERSSERVNEYSLLEEGLLPLGEKEEGPYEIKWDLDYNPSEGPKWEDVSFKEGMYKKYDDVGLKSVLLEYENGAGDKRRCLQSAWVLGKFDLTSTYEESGSEERFFHLPEDKGPFEHLSGEDSLKNTYILETEGNLTYEHIDFRFLGENHTVNNFGSGESSDVWKKSFSVSDASRDTQVRVIPYLDNRYRDEIESPLHIPHEVGLKNEKEVDVINTPDWFPYLLDEFFGDNLEINNTEEDGDYVGWEVKFKIPEVEDEDELKDSLEQMDISGAPQLNILDDLQKYFGGDYGFELKLFPDREITFDNNLDFETTLIKFHTNSDQDDMDVDSFDGELGNSYEYAADPEIEVSAGVTVDLLVKEEGISVSGQLTLDVGASIQIDIPLNSIGLAEVGLTAEIGGEIGVEYDVGALKYEVGSGLGLGPGDGEVPIEFLLNFGGGPYGEVGAGLARVEGKLILEVIVGLELPSKDTGIEHSGKFEVEVSAGWGLWSKTRDWKLYSTGDSTSTMSMGVDKSGENQMFKTDRLATRDYGMNEDETLVDSNGFGERRNVGPRVDPEIASLDKEKAIAVWSELSKDSEGDLRSDLFMQEFSGGSWESDSHQITTEGNMAYDPKLVEFDNEIALIYKEIEEKPGNFESVSELESYYTNDTLRGKSWNGSWSDLGLNHTIEDQAITSFDVDVDDQGEIHIVYRSGYPSLDLFESPTSEEGNVSVLKQDEGDWKKIVKKKATLPQSSRPSIGFAGRKGGVVYTRTIEDKGRYNQTVLVPINGGEKNVTKTTNTTSHHLLSGENGKLVVTWVENHTEIRRKVIGDSWNVPEKSATVNSNEIVTGLSHHVNATSNYYVFQKGVNTVPTIVEACGDEWSNKRSILDEKNYAPDQLDPDFGLTDPTMILVEKRGAIESWHQFHHRFDGALSDGYVKDRSGKYNTGELKGNWTREEHGSTRDHGRYGHYVDFGGEGRMVVNHSSSLNVTEDTEDFTVTALLDVDDYQDGDHLMRKEDSWGVVFDDGKMRIELQDENGSHTFLTDMNLTSGWTFFALRYEGDRLNVTLRGYTGTGSLDENTETIHLDDLGPLSSSVAPLKLAEGSGSLSVDDFRLMNRYLPDASIEKINRTSYPSFDVEYAVNTEKILPYVNFTHSESLVVGEPVGFTAQSSHKGFNYSWSFEGVEQKYGKEIEYKFNDTGYHTVTLEAEDNETGAKTRFKKTLHVIDVNPPRFDVESEVVKRYEGNNSVRVGWGEAEGESEPFEYRIHHETGGEVEFSNNSWSDSTGETTIVVEDLDPALEHHILVSVVNDVGLTNTSASSISFEIEDSVAPEFEGLNSTYVDHKEMKVGLRWYEADDRSAVSYNIYHSAGEEIGFEDPIKTTERTEIEVSVSEIGEQHFAVRAEDDWENEDGNEEVKMVVVKDVESPEIEITNPLDGETSISTVTVEWEAHDNDSEISAYWVKRDDENWNRVEKQNYTFRYLPEGKRTLFVKAIDDHNNSADDSIDLNIVAEISPKIDFSSPTPADSSTDVGTDVELSVDVEHETEKELNVSFHNADSDEEIEIDEGVSSGGTASVEWEGLEDNTTYEWYVEADDGENSNRSVVWNFTTSSVAVKGYTLQINIEGNGTVGIDPNKDLYEEGIHIVLNATPHKGWFFKNWTGDHESREKETNITMDGKKNITANFEKLEDHLLTIDIEGEGTTAPSLGRYTYEDGQNLTIQASPEDGWYFVEWKGDHNSSEEEITVEMNSDKQIVAIFSEGGPEKYELTAQVEGKGSVDIDPDREEYEEGTVVNLTAISFEDWDFSHWTVDRKDLDGEEEITVKMDSDVEVTAHFEEGSVEDSEGPLSSIFSVPVALGIIFVSLIAAVLVLNHRSDGEIFEK